jgi:ribosomal protein L19E
LKEYVENGKISRSTYRKFYRYAKGGMIKSKSHLDAQLKAMNAFIEAGGKP